MVKMSADAIRDLLLEMESRQGSVTFEIDVRPVCQLDGRLAQYDHETLRHNLMLMLEKGYFNGTQDSGFTFTVNRLTVAGSEFLETVRDPKIWEKAKKGAEDAGGFTVDVLKDLAKGLLKKQIEKHTGVEL